MKSKTFALLSLLFAVAVQAADLPDVTLQPWSVRTIIPSGNHSLSSTNGMVLLYREFNEPNLSTDFGQTWSRFGEGSVINHTFSDSTAFTGNGYFLFRWFDPSRSQSVLGINNQAGDRILGYANTASGGGLLVGIESYSTYVSADKGATWTPYLNPFSPDGVTLVSFDRIFHDGTSFVAVTAQGASGYNTFQGSTWRSPDGVSWHRILDSDAACMDSQGRLVVAKGGMVYDLVGDALVPAHKEFPTADANIDYHRVENRIYAAKGDLLYYSDDKGTNRFRTGFPESILTIWTRPSAGTEKHVVEVFLSDQRVFTSIPVVPLRLASVYVPLLGIEMRPMLTFEAQAGSIVIIEASSSPDGGWVEVTRVTATGGRQTWNDNRELAGALFYRARSQ